METDAPGEPKILIVGAGPVGLTAAIELSRRGFTPRIIDRAPGPAGESRALGIHARTLEIFEPSQITERLLAAGNPVRRAVLSDRDGELLQLDFSLARQKYNYVLILPQYETERILQSALNERGVDVQWGTRLDDFQIVNSKIQCTIGGSALPQSYDILIGCDGAHSAVRQTLEIGFDGTTDVHDWHLIDVTFQGTRATDEFHIKTLNGFVIAYFPLSPHCGRFVTNSPDVLAAAADAVEIDQVLWQSDFRISHRIVETYQQGNVFLVGDAAHVHSPVGGRGMNLGIEDAATLAWLIETGQTDRYTSLRKPIGQAVLRFTDSQTRQITSSSSLLRFARRHLAPLLLKSKAVQRFVFRRISGASTPKPPWLVG